MSKLAPLRFLPLRTPGPLHALTLDYILISGLWRLRAAPISRSASRALLGETPIHMHAARPHELRVPFGTQTEVILGFKAYQVVSGDATES